MVSDMLQKWKREALLHVLSFLNWQYILCSFKFHMFKLFLMKIVLILRWHSWYPLGKADWEARLSRDCQLDA